MLSIVKFKVSHCDCHNLQCLIVLNFQVEISKTVYSNVYIKVKKVCLKAINHGPDVQCHCLIYWSVIFQLWMSSSTIQAVHPIIVVSLLNALDQTDPKNIRMLVKNV